MLEINSHSYSEYAAKHLAQINTGEGVIEISWIARRKEILCKYQGRYYRGQNEQIGTTVATLMNCSSDVLVPSELKVYEGGTGYEYGTERQLKDLLECEWSDYAYDKMAFQCYMFRAQL